MLTRKIATVFNHLIGRYGRFLCEIGALKSQDFLNLGANNFQLQVEKNKFVSKVWDESSERIFNEVFNSKNGFFREPFFKQHLAMPNEKLGNFIINQLSQESYGRKLIAMISDSPIGRPYLLRKIPTLSSVTASHLANIKSIKDNLDIDLINSKLSFVDFGGGFGGLSRALSIISNDLNLSIIDLPFMIEIQKKYLELTLSNPTVDFYTIDEFPKIKIDIFNASFSLSETPENVRKMVEEIITINANSFHIIFQRNHRGFDNYDYFDKFKRRLENSFEIKLKSYSYYNDNDNFWLIYGIRK